MDAKICDRCGKMWRCGEGCDAISIMVCKTNRGMPLGQTRNLDLCKDCLDGLFEYLKMLPNHPFRNGKGDKQ